MPGYVLYGSDVGSFSQCMCRNDEASYVHSRRTSGSIRLGFIYLSFLLLARSIKVASGPNRCLSILDLPLHLPANLHLGSKRSAFDCCPQVFFRDLSRENPPDGITNLHTANPQICCFLTYGFRRFAPIHYIYGSK